MSRFLFLSILCFLSIIPLFSQQTTYGIKAGGNIANLTDNDDFNSKFGIHFGAVAQIELSETLKLQPEFLYSAQGYQRDLPDNQLRLCRIRHNQPGSSQDVLLETRGQSDQGLL